MRMISYGKCRRQSPQVLEFPEGNRLLCHEHNILLNSIYNAPAVLWVPDRLTVENRQGRGIQYFCWHHHITKTYISAKKIVHRHTIQIRKARNCFDAGNFFDGFPLITAAWVRPIFWANWTVVRPACRRASLNRYGIWSRSFLLLYYIFQSQKINIYIF